MAVYDKASIRKRIDHYVDNELLPPAKGIKVRYGQLFWDADTSKNGWPFHCYMQQDKEEFRKLCYFILDHEIHSYLEIGIYTGIQSRLLDEIFNFERVAIANLDEFYLPGFLLSKESERKVVGVFQEDSDYYLGEFPKKFEIFIGNSQSEQYREWRKASGHFDLTFIDADHSYSGISKDFEQNTSDVSHKYVAFHDIGQYTEGFLEVKKLWDQLDGNKVELRTYTKPPYHMGIGVYWQS